MGPEHSQVRLILLDGRDHKWFLKRIYTNCRLGFPYQVVDIADQSTIKKQNRRYCADLDYQATHPQNKKHFTAHDVQQLAERYLPQRIV